MSVKTAPVPPRNPGLYKAGRVCPRCNAELNTNNPGPHCQPCQLALMPEEERCD